jgi:putative hydrolase of the HAD superfamily
VLTEFWNEMDMGIRTEQDAIEHFTTLYPQYKEEILCFWAHTEGLVSEYPYSKSLIRGLKELGYGVYILSNYPVEISERHWPRFQFLPETDGHIISAFEKLVKPDPRIYRLLFSRFGLVPEECLFIDDRMKNIEGAEAVGMQSLLFTGLDQLLQELRTRGIDVKIR